MRVTDSKFVYEMCNDDTKKCDLLPAGCYIIRFSPQTDFFLEKYSEIKVNEQKVYGPHPEKAKKVMQSFQKFNRNLGVIVSGKKGSGRTLFLKLLAQEALKERLPVIIVEKYIPGIIAVIERISQEALVLFDEFDKTFCDVCEGEDEVNTDCSLFTLLDGFAQGKKLLAVTCSDVRKLEENFLNRPGRFHYHFRFEYPKTEDIKEYLEDNLEKQYYPEIEQVISFSGKVGLSYDCLRTVAFELNCGEKFTEIIKELNLVNTEKIKYQVKVYYGDGTVTANDGFLIDLFSGCKSAVPVYDKKGDYMGTVILNPPDLCYDGSKDEMYVDSEDIRIRFDEDCYDLDNEIYEDMKKKKVCRISLKRKPDRKLYYCVS